MEHITTEFGIRAGGLAPLCIPSSETRPVDYAQDRLFVVFRVGNHRPKSHVHSSLTHRDRVRKIIRWQTLASLLRQRTLALHYLKLLSQTTYALHDGEIFSCPDQWPRLFDSRRHQGQNTQCHQQYQLHHTMFTL